MNELPRGWVLATLGDVARWGSGGTPRAGDPRFYGGPIPWAVIGDLTDGPVSATAATITEEGLRQSSAKLVPPGAVLVAMYGSIGKLGLTTVTMATNQAIAFAIAHESVVEPRYLMHFLRHQRPRLADAGKGATQRNIGQGTLKAWPIPVPPLEEQHRIVDILEDHLSRLDSASAYLRRAEARASAFGRSSVESTIRSTPSRRLRLHEVVARLEAGKSFGAGGRPAAAHEWGIIKVSAMTWGAFRPDENKAVDDPARVNSAHEIHAGDVLVSRANTTDYVGACVYVETTRPRLLLSDKSLRIVPRDGVDSRWLQTVLSAPSTRAQISERATGTKDSMRNISQPALLSVQIPVPAPADQAQIVEAAARAADSVTRLLDSVQRSFRRAAALRRALLQAAFSGRLTGAASDIDGVEELAGV